MTTSHGPLDRERLTETHRELLEHIREEDEDLAPVAEEILAEIETDRP